MIFARAFSCACAVPASRAQACHVPADGSNLTGHRHGASSNELNPGLQGLKLKTLQALRGNLQFWTYVLPGLRPELGVVDRLLSLCHADDPAVDLKCPAEEAERAYQDLEDTVELMRLLSAGPERWRSTFTGAFTSMLDPAERLALPEADREVVWVRSDAVMDKFAATDYTNRVYSLEEVAEFWQALQQAAITA